MIPIRKRTEIEKDLYNANKILALSDLVDDLRDTVAEVSRQRLSAETEASRLRDALKTAVVNFKILDKESSYWDVSVALEVCEKALQK